MLQIIAMKPFDALPAPSEAPTASPRSVASCASDTDSDVDLAPQSPVEVLDARLPEKVVLNRVQEECALIVFLLKDNLNAGATPVVVMYLATASATTGATLSGTVAAAMMGLLYLSMFDLVNQWSGVEEDMVDKPWRPIPRGLMSAPGRCLLQSLFPKGPRYCFPNLMILIVPHIEALRVTIELLRTSLIFLLYGQVRGCKIRCGLVAIACLAASYFYSLLIPCMLCFLATFGYSVGWDKNCIFRGFVFMPMVFMIHFQVSMRLALGPSSDSRALLHWAVTFAAYYSIPFLLQDLRDLEGDAKGGRRTLPVLLGARNFRATLFVLLAVLSPPGFYRLLGALVAQQASLALVCALWNSLFLIAILYMLATGDGVKAHRLAYKLVVFMYTFGTGPCLYFIVPSVLAS